MKKLKLNNWLFFLFIMTLLLSTIYSCNTNHTLDSNLIATTEVGVKFGKSDICIGSGICTIKPSNEFSNEKFDASGELIYEDGKLLELQLSKSSISDTKLDEQFGGNLFEIQDNLDFKSEKDVIQKGRYLIVENDDYIILSFANNQ